jgi:hypothetical protein
LTFFFRKVFNSCFVILKNLNVLPLGTIKRAGT